MMAAGGGGGSSAAKMTLSTNDNGIVLSNTEMATRWTTIPKSGIASCCRGGDHGFGLVVVRRLLSRVVVW